MSNTYTADNGCVVTLDKLNETLDKLKAEKNHDVDVFVMVKEDYDQLKDKVEYEFKEVEPNIMAGASYFGIPVQVYEDVTHCAVAMCLHEGRGVKALWLSIGGDDEQI